MTLIYENTTDNFIPHNE